MGLGEAIAGVAARLLAQTLAGKGGRFIVYGPTGIVVFRGLFDGVEVERVKDGRGFVYFVRVRPLVGLDWVDPARRPRLIDHTKIEWNEELVAWTHRE